MKIITYIGIIISLLFSTQALADGQPFPWQMGFQEAASPMMERYDDFHDMLNVIIITVAIFVFILLTYTCVRFHQKNNPKPSKTTHNTLLEIVWTAVPVIILVIVAIPSLRLLYYVDDDVDADMTLKVIGYQWYWGYQYPDHGDIAFDSYMLKDDELGENDPRLLAVDNRVVLPIDTKVRVQLTAADVIHAWAIPALGVKIDAVPGRLNETWLEITKPGTYYGQCSELCGVGHGFMPIAIEAVTKERFEQWVENAKRQFAAGEEIQQVASN
jgi:cytochrome c oxidase subunit 2